jgi:hypothetical protein
MQVLVLTDWYLRFFMAYLLPAFLGTLAITGICSHRDRASIWLCFNDSSKRACSDCKARSSSKKGRKVEPESSLKLLFGPDKN